MHTISRLLTTGAVALAAVLPIQMSMSSCSKTNDATADGFNYRVDRFADIEVLRYKVPDFDSLSLQQKCLVYYLTEAALWGRDILWDQNYRHNLAIRELLENIYGNYSGDRNSADYKNFETYLKQVWFANGIHHHYSNDKFTPAFSREFFNGQVAALPEGTVPENIAELTEVIFNPTLAAKKVNLAEGQDLVVTSCTNLYDEGITQAEVEDFYSRMKKEYNDTVTPISYGLNSRVDKRDGKLYEQTYKIGGLYSDAIEKIVRNLRKATKYAENPRQLDVIETLIDFYTTGDLRTFDEYSIKWAGDTASQVDFINGFIETYGDPVDLKGSWESIVNFKDFEASRRTETLSANAQWFEDNSPVNPIYKKEKVKGVSAKVITAAILAGDSYPSTPIGINLPNSTWIRAQHGSKSVTLANITNAYDMAAKGSGFNEEFVIDGETLDLINKYLAYTDELHTDLHECLGHASGRLLPGVADDALKAHGSAIEETRADLFALYYLADPKMIEIGLIDNPEAYKAEYYKYILNGMMTQLMRIEPGKDIEEAHMRNRKLIAEWVYEHGKADNVIELVKKDGKTYIRINDYEALRGLFGQLLAEIQRIRSTGDYEGARQLIETYAVKVDPELHKEVLERSKKLNMAEYKGFVNPVYTPVFDNNNIITDIKVSYDEGYIDQMLRYGKQYHGLK